MNAIRTQLEQDVRGKEPPDPRSSTPSAFREQRTLRFGTLEAEVQRLTTSAGEMNRRTRCRPGNCRATASQRAEAYGTRKPTAS